MTRRPKVKPLERVPRYADYATRLWEALEVQPNGCWIPPNQKRRAMMHKDGKTVFMYRIAYELSKGPITPGMSICHSCDNGLCCNPAHLWQGSAADNAADKVKKGRCGDVSGLKNGLSGRRLSNNEVLEIRTRADLGEATVKLAKEYGVHRTTIRLIATRKIWKFL